MVVPPLINRIFKRKITIHTIGDSHAKIPWENIRIKDFQIHEWRFPLGSSNLEFDNLFALAAAIFFLLGVGPPSFSGGPPLLWPKSSCTPPPTGQLGNLGAPWPKRKKKGKLKKIDCQIHEWQFSARQLQS